jgi:ferredoxin--NADP+ reductase
MMIASDDRFYRARITERVDLAADLWTIRIRPDGELKFVPGQYATLCRVGPEKRYERAYSIASSPYESELEFFLELVPTGELTPQLYDLKSGDELLMRKVPKGRFLLDTSNTRTKHLLICTVTGVAPFVSYARTLYRDWTESRFAGDHTLYLINGASRSWEFGYARELEKIAAEVPWLKYVPTISRPWDDLDWKGEVGRVDDLLRKYTDMWGLTGANTLGYLCGHPGMVEHCKNILGRIGFSRDSLKEEIYWIPPKQAAASAG